MSPSMSAVSVAPAANGNFGLTDLTADLYRDLRRIAAKHLGGERRNHTLQPTALVNEVYLKLANSQARSFNDDAHFLSVASRVMRQVLVDYARSRQSQKRNADGQVDCFLDAMLQVNSDDGPQMMDLIALDDALGALSAENERLARIVEMRFFGGMTAEETAEALDMSVHIVRHELRFAQAWLRRRLGS